MRYLYLVFISLVIVACHSPSQKERGASYSAAKERPADLIKQLNSEKKIIENIWQTDSNAISVYIKKEGKKELVRIYNGEFPDYRIDYTYNILEKGNKVLKLVISPCDDAGDSNIEARYYFDANGKTFIYNYIDNSFGGLPDDGVVMQTEIKFFDTNFKLIKKDSKLADDKGKPLSPDYKTEKPADLEKIYPTASACLKAYHIRLN